MRTSLVDQFISKEPLDARRSKVPTAAERCVAQAALETIGRAGLMGIHSDAAVVTIKVNTTDANLIAAAEQAAQKALRFEPSAASTYSVQVRASPELGRRAFDAMKNDIEKVLRLNNLDLVSHHNVSTNRGCGGIFLRARDSVTRDFDTFDANSETAARVKHVLESIRDAKGFNIVPILIEVGSAD
jgi:hypothetical protein